MDQWLTLGLHQVNILVGEDEEYQRLLAEMNKAQAEYDAVMEKLALEDQQKVEHYIALCEDLEYQKTIAAWYCGKKTKCADC